MLKVPYHLRLAMASAQSALPYATPALEGGATAIQSELVEGISTEAPDHGRNGFFCAAGHHLYTLQLYIALHSTTSTLTL